MAKKLHVAKLWQIEYKRPGMSGSTGQDALYRILRMFDVDNSAEDICTDEFVLRRSGLQELRLHIAGTRRKIQCGTGEFRNGQGEVYRNT